MESKQGKGTGKSGVSLEKLVAEINRLAGDGDFTKAEKLRELLLVEHPMELSAIISTAEVIEEEKSRRIDQEHLAIWPDLYDDLSQEERNLLFHATKAAKVATGKVMLRQGKAVPRLLFIDSGRVTLFHTRGDERKMVGQLSRGDILGDETFFELSTPTFSAGAQSDVTLRFLDKSATANWEEQQPGLLGKLAAFSRKKSRAAELISRNQFEKRRSERVKAEGKVSAHILSPEGKPTGDLFRGSLSDLSTSGVCFSMHSPRTEVVQALLGRLIDLEFEAEDVGTGNVVRGTVVKVGILLHNDFTVHMQLQQPIGEDRLRLYERKEE